MPVRHRSGLGASARFIGCVFKFNITDEDADAATIELASRSGIDVCPEGGAAWSALRQLRDSGFIKPEDNVVVFNTGTGLKYR